MARHIHIDGIDWLVGFKVYIPSVGPLRDGFFIAEHPASCSRFTDPCWASLWHRLWVESQAIFIDQEIDNEPL